ncbi:MAG: hypothetical protein KDA44_06355 [Planctomycetales bacterium]|nr:hypothetical protein [Planctomycetales bacterium]
MNHSVVGAIAAIALFFAMLASAVAGHRYGIRLFRRDGDAAAGTGTVDAAILSLLGLLIAFTFSGAYKRYESRRGLVVQEANNIGTAYLRIDLLRESDQTPMRDLFRKYLQTRLDFWESLSDVKLATALHDQTVAIQGQIWDLAVHSTAGDETRSARLLLLPALNAMFDITTTRLAAIQAHPPVLIFVMLAALAVSAAALVGFGMGNSPRPKIWHVVGLAAISAATIYVILDIEYPRFGWVTLDSAQEALSDQLQQMR